jgi:ribulose-phosphate 3-epimerase
MNKIVEQNGMNKPSAHKRKISVSIMCSDLLNLGQDVDHLERLGIDYLHVDVMDAHLVPNLTFGPDFINALHRHTNMPLDIHAMMTEPELLLSRITLRPTDFFSVHVELEDAHIRRIAEMVHAAGAQFGLAVNPETDVTAIAPYVDVLDEVIVMLVKPGFAKGKLIDGILNKVADMHNFIAQSSNPKIKISVDGSVSHERAHAMAAMGADIFVGGTAGIYMEGRRLEDTVAEFRKAIEN